MHGRMLCGVVLCLLAGTGCSSVTPGSDEAEARVAALTQGGLNLTQPFYELLTEYEGSSAAFDEFFPILLERLPAYEEQHDQTRLIHRPRERAPIPI